jgi:hypothetical protein
MAKIETLACFEVSSPALTTGGSDRSSWNKNQGFFPKSKWSVEMSSQSSPQR